MNRRNFLRGLLTAAAGFTILPPATTYERIWRARREINPDWITAPYEMSFIWHPKTLYGKWTFVSTPDLLGELELRDTIFFNRPS